MAQGRYLGEISGHVDNAKHVPELATEFIEILITQNDYILTANLLFKELIIIRQTLSLFIY